MNFYRKTTKQVEVKLVDVFTSEPFQGNPITVVPYGDNLEDDEKKAIIKEMNTEKGVFIGDSTDGKSDFKISIFTDVEEIDSDYQSLISAAYVMVCDKHINLKVGNTNVLTEQTRNGIFPIIIHSKGKELQQLMVMTHWKEKPEFRRVDYDSVMVADILGLESEDLRSDIMIQAVKMNNWSMIIPIKDIKAFDKVSFNPSKLTDMAVENNVHFISLFFLDDSQHEIRVSTRIFYPNITRDVKNNYLEDSITGQSNCGIAAYLFEHKLIPTEGSKIKIRFDQKSQSNRKGLVFVEMDIVNDFINEISIGGKAIIVLDGKMKLTPY